MINIWIIQTNNLNAFYRYGVCVALKGFQVIETFRAHVGRQICSGPYAQIKHSTSSGTRGLITDWQLTRMEIQYGKNIGDSKHIQNYKKKVEQAWEVGASKCRRVSYSSVSSGVVRQHGARAKWPIDADPRFNPFGNEPGVYDLGGSLSQAITSYISYLRRINWYPWQFTYYKLLPGLLFFFSATICILKISSPLQLLDPGTRKDQR